MPDLARRGANLAFAALQLALPPILFGGRGFNAEADAGPPSPAEPAGYAFAIWGPIYLGCLAYAVVQALPSRAADPLFRRIGWLTAAGFALTGAWLLAARFGPVWATVPIIWLMTAAIGTAFVIAAGAARPGLVEAAFVRLPLALFAGWLTAAAFVNAAEVLPRFGFDRFGLSPAGFAVLVVGAAGALAGALAGLTRGEPAYALAVLWALGGIAAANVMRASGSPVVIAAAGAAGLALVAWCLALRRPSRRWRSAP